MFKINKNIKNKSKEPRTFFSVSLKDNVSSLCISIPKILKFYPHAKYFLICRQVDKDFFHSKLPKNNRIIFISEESLISYVNFTILFKKISKTSKISRGTTSKHLSWYYQQALKLTFVLNEQNSKSFFPAVMFDADSILLKKIDFFSDINNSILYGSLSERHCDYFKSLDVLFKHYNYPTLGFTTQFFSTTYSEMKVLKTQMKKKYLKYGKIKIEDLVTYVILESTLIAHGKLNGSKFSEQELVGVSNTLNSIHKKQIPIISFRSWVLFGIVTSLQMKFLSCFGVTLLTYENRISFKSKELSWFSFLRFFISDIKPQIQKLIKIQLKYILFKLFKKERV